MVVTFSVVVTFSGDTPDVQTDEYETDDSNEKDNNVQYELPVNERRTTMSVELSEQSRG